MIKKRFFFDAQHQDYDERRRPFTSMGDSRDCGRPLTKQAVLEAMCEDTDDAEDLALKKLIVEQLDYYYTKANKLFGTRVYK